MLLLLLLLPLVGLPVAPGGALAVGRADDARLLVSIWGVALGACMLPCR